MKRQTCFPAIFFSLTGLFLIFAALFTPRGAGISFLFQLAGALGVWALLVGASYLPRRGKIRRVSMICRRVLFALTAFFLLIYGLSLAYIVAGSNPAHDENYDAIIVLGAGLNGETPSAILYSRMKLALEELKANPSSVAVLSGGQGAGERISEAEAMRRYFVKNGIEEDRLILEDQSRNTSQNIRFSKVLLEERFPQGCDTLVVTNEFHIARALMLSSRAGLNAQGAAAATPEYRLLKVTYYLREGFALIQSAVIG